MRKVFIRLYVEIVIVVVADCCIETAPYISWPVIVNQMTFMLHL